MPEQLNGNALVAEVAEKVMGWFDAENNPGRLEYPFFLRSPYPSHDEITVSGSSVRSMDWNPLSSMSDAWEIIAAVEAKTGYITGLMHYPKTWACSFWQIGEDDPVVEHECDNPYEAICLASLKAIERCQPE